MSGAWDEQPAKLLHHYDRTAQRAAHQVICSYSSSFNLASNLLRGTIKTDIRSLYAVVRIADEIVDGAGHAAGLNNEQCRELLDDYEAQVLRAPRQRLHRDPIMHAYGITARRCEFADEHIRAFFTSMRRDLGDQSTNEKQEFDAYIYGSAEVIGLLCLQAFLVGRDVSAADRQAMEHGARKLGAAFQKTNFLRDIANDTEFLGRQYFPQLQDDEFNDAIKTELVADIRTDLAAARRSVALLPLDARIGVVAALELFNELTNDIDRLTAAELLSTRVSLSPARKTRVLARIPRTVLKKDNQKKGSK